MNNIIDSSENIIDLTPGSEVKFDNVPEYNKSALEKNISENINEYNIQHKNDKQINNTENFGEILDNILLDVNNNDIISNKEENVPVDNFSNIINNCFIRNENGFLVQNKEWKS